METEPDSSGPPQLPRPLANTEWIERVGAWRERAREILDRGPVLRVIGVLLALVIAIGFSWPILQQRTAAPPVESLLPTLEPGALVVSTPVPVSTTIVVHVAGAVARPGLVELQTGARVADAVAAAGGATADGDLDRVNLATLLGDEDRVVIPVVGEEPAALLGPAAVSSEAAGPIDLNRATAAQLQELPGIGPATAAAIVAYRDQHGPFTTVTSLDDVPGIGPAKLAQLRELVSVGP